MVADLVRAEGFRDGLLPGTVGAIALLVAGHRARWIPPAGAVVVAALVGLAALGRLPGALVAAVALLAVAFWLTDREATTALVVPLVVVPGALLIGIAADVTDPAWLGPFVILLALVGSACLADLAAHPSVRGLGPTFVVLTALGIYAAVPETGEITVFIGALLPLSLLGLRRDPPYWDASTASALAGLMTWAAATGGQARPSSVIGSAVCFGVVLVDPLVVRGLHGRNQPTVVRGTTPRLVALLVIHLGVVAFGSRVVGLRTSSVQSALLAACALAGALVAVGGVELATRALTRRSG